MPIVKSIARRKTRQAPRSRFGASIRYAATINDRESEVEIAASRHDFSASVDYASREKDDGAQSGERVALIILNGVTSLSTAAAELEAIASQRPRVTDPVRHVVLSFDSARGEDPTAEEIKRDIEIVLRERCMTNAPKRRGNNAVERFQLAREGEINPYVAIAHADTDSLHVHIIASSISADGVANPDFRDHIANEHAAAQVATAHGWEIVAGRFNMTRVTNQAHDAGATAAEIVALRRRDASTLSRLREMATEATAEQRLTVVEKARPDELRTFRDRYGSQIRDALANTQSFADFVARYAEEQVLVKYRVEFGQDGREYPKLAFSEIHGKAGDSGTKVGVTAKMLLAKFDMSQAVATTSSQAHTSKAPPEVDLVTIRATMQNQMLSPAERQLADLTVDARANETQERDALDRPVNSESEHLIEAIAANAGSLRGLPRERRDEDDPSRAINSSNGATSRLGTRRVRLEAQLAQTTSNDRRRNETKDESASVEMRARYDADRAEYMKRVRAECRARRKTMRMEHAAKTAFRIAASKSLRELRILYECLGAPARRQRAIKAAIRAEHRNTIAEIRAEHKMEWKRKKETLRLESARQFPVFDAWLAVQKADQTREAALRTKIANWRARREAKPRTAAALQPMPTVDRALSIPATPPPSQSPEQSPQAKTSTPAQEFRTEFERRAADISAGRDQAAAEAGAHRLSEQVSKTKKAKKTIQQPDQRQAHTVPAKKSGKDDFGL